MDAALSTCPGPSVVQVRRLWHHLPRLEWSLLIVGLLCNSYGKYYALARRLRTDFLLSLADVVSRDLIFFGVLAAMIVVMGRCCPWKLACRISLFLASIACGWSAANMAWLVSTGAQLHVGVLACLLHDPVEFGSVGMNRLSNTPRFTVPLSIAFLVLCSAMSWRFIRTGPAPSPRAAKSRNLPASVFSAALVIVGLVASNLSSYTDPRRAALAFSSHWFALTSLVGFDGSSRPDETQNARHIARQGERRVPAPPPGSRPPHVIMIVMESTALWATSFGEQTREHTPALAELAERGIFFERTRAVVTHTTQSQFAILTGVSPNLGGGFVEAVLVDSPYESLATILGRQGYRSLFAQMVRASFECNPGLVANLGFDHFWAREDAHDPASHLGYFAGDDFKMIAPTFAWLDRQTDPCFVFLMTSVAHHPYQVPSWYGPTMPDDRQAYLQCIRYTDAFVGEVMAQLKRRGLYDDTLICILGDHGEGMPDHNVVHHNENPYEQGLRVPWIVTWPRGIAVPRVVRENCSLLDVTPTLLELLGFDVGEAGFEGSNALASSPVDRRRFFMGWGTNSPAGYVQGVSKYVLWPSLSTAYRFDLAADPEESRPEMLDAASRDRLRTEIDAWRNRSRIAFDTKRFRKRRLFDRWQTSTLGDWAWCYYLEPKTPSTP